MMKKVSTTARLWMTVHETLPVRSPDRGPDAGSVVHLSGVPAELELAHVSMKVFSTDVVERPDDATLEQRKEALDRVRGDEQSVVPTSVLIDGVGLGFTRRVKALST